MRYCLIISMMVTPHKRGSFHEAILIIWKIQYTINETLKFCILFISL